ncbi:MAG: hypothetical protein Q7U11_15950, partial [Phenylobacterium sp.]|nr:hypothetical protein [Phenylobacterium sp.]
RADVIMTLSASRGLVRPGEAPRDPRPPSGEAGRFGVYLAVMAWGGLWLRDARLRSLFPWRRL